MGGGQRSEINLAPKVICKDFYFYMYECSVFKYMHISTPHVLAETRGGHWIPKNWSYRRL